MVTEVSDELRHSKNRILKMVNPNIRSKYHAIISISMDSQLSEITVAHVEYMRVDSTGKKSFVMSFKNNIKRSYKVHPPFQPSTVSLTNGYIKRAGFLSCDIIKNSTHKKVKTVDRLGFYIISPTESREWVIHLTSSVTLIVTRDVTNNELFQLKLLLIDM
jgi:hypothetical protein